MLTRLTVSALQRLAKHYLPDGWQEWAWDDPDESNITGFADIEQAVAAYPATCHRALAENWGLEYGQLERPAGQKRKADSEVDSRPSKVQKHEGHTEISLRFGQDPERAIIRRTTLSEPDATVPTHMTLEEIRRQYRVPGYPQSTDEVLWYTSSMSVARHRTRAALGRSPLLSNSDNRLGHTTGSEFVDEADRSS